VGLNSLKSLNLTNVYPNNKNNKVKSKPLELYELAFKKDLLGHWVENPRKLVMVMRFLGTTPTSSSIPSLVMSICQQICYNMEVGYRLSKASHGTNDY
jgi:hypothetical protein